MCVGGQVEIEANACSTFDTPSPGMSGGLSAEPISETWHALMVHVSHMPFDELGLKHIDNNWSYMYCGHRVVVMNA